MDKNPQVRSFFWPILLVGVGIIWLLRNLGFIPQFSLGAILQFWPLLLIVLGLDILFSRRFPWIGTAVGLIAVAAIVVYLVSGPSLGLNTGSTVLNETFSEPSQGTSTVKYVFDTASSPVNISVLDEDDKELILANFTHRGVINFDVSGTKEKTVHISEDFENSTWLNWDFSFDRLKWDIALNPNVPADVKLNGGSGSIDMDLRGLSLNTLALDLGSGSSDLWLPQSSQEYEAEIESGSGSVTIDLPEETSLILSLDTGSGSTSVNLPSDAAVRIEVMDDGSGSLSLPDGLTKSSDSAKYSIGAWQTADFTDSENQVIIKIKGQGSGSISID